MILFVPCGLNTHSNSSTYLTFSFTLKIFSCKTFIIFYCYIINKPMSYLFKFFFIDSIKFPSARLHYSIYIFLHFLSLFNSYHFINSDVICKASDNTSFYLFVMSNIIIILVLLLRGQYKYRTIIPLLSLFSKS